MNDQRDSKASDGQPSSAEGEEAARVSEDLPEEVGGEGATPLGSSDEHSGAPGPHGLGRLTESEEEGSPGLAPLEDEPDS